MLFFAVRYQPEKIRCKSEKQIGNIGQEYLEKIKICGENIKIKKKNKKKYKQIDQRATVIKRFIMKSKIASII